MTKKTPLPFYFMRQPNPERGLFMDIQKKKIMNIYGFIDGHKYGLSIKY